jgi:hypothetical protein
MRTCIGISVVIHAAVMLWLVLAPGVRTLGPANAEAIMVDLVPPQETRAAAPPPQSQDAKSPDRKTEQAKSEEPKPEPSRTAPRKPEALKPDPVKPDSVKSRGEEQAATAARLAWLLNLPTETEASLAGPPSESKSNLSSDEIAQFKTQVSKCWVAPAGTPNRQDIFVSFRLAFKPNGTLGAPPELIAAPSDIDGNPLAESARRALRKCQPYTALPPDRYLDWKILDMSFTAQGPTVLAGPAKK